MKLVGGILQAAEATFPPPLSWMWYSVFPRYMDVLFQKIITIREIREKLMSIKMSPPIFVYGNGHWYQSVALSELVWMEYVDFFIS